MIDYPENLMQFMIRFKPSKAVGKPFHENKDEECRECLLGYYYIEQGN